MDNPLRVIIHRNVSCIFPMVLILIVMDNPLRAMEDLFSNEHRSVLILIVMDNPLRAPINGVCKQSFGSLNPYCNG